MISSAKYFVGQFANNRDYIGAITFSDNYNLLSAPTLNFQSTLGYTNGFSTGAGALDNITCSGGTATPIRATADLRSVKLFLYRLQRLWKQC
jgi:hypothetical protein